MPVWRSIPEGENAFLSAKHLADQAGRYEPQRGHSFELLIMPPVGDAEVLLKSVEAAIPVSHMSEPLQLSYMNEHIYIAGRPTYAPGAVTYRDMVTEPVYEIMELWYQRVYDVTTAKIGFAADYKSMGTLTLYDVKGGNPRSWELIGLWPQDISAEPPNHMASDIMRLNVTFQYDKAWPLFAYQCSS